MIVKLLIKHHLEFLSLKGGCRGLSESTHVKMQHCWKSHALAHIILTPLPLPTHSPPMFVVHPEAAVSLLLVLSFSSNP